MSPAGAVAAVLTIAVLVAALVAVTTGFLLWVDGNRLIPALLGAAGAFATTITILITVFTTIGPLDS